MSNPLPRVSIVMPVHNAAQTVALSLASVCGQQLTDWELIAVDHGSTDNSACILREWAASDARIRVAQLPGCRSGPSRPRNLGIAQAAGRYLAFLDADDIWYPNKLSTQLAAMVKHDTTLSCCGYHVFHDQPGDTIGQLMPPLSAQYADLLKRNTAGCSTVMIDRERIGDIRFPECGHEDYALWLSLMKSGRTMLGVQQCLAAYRRTPGSVSANKFRNISYLWHIYRHQEQFSMPMSAFLTLRYAINALTKYRASPAGTVTS